MSEDFFPVLPAADLADRTAQTVQVGRKKVAIVRVGEKLHAVDALCTHMGVPLTQGELEGEELVCPWHAARFCVVTGAKKSGPGFCDLDIYHVRERNGWIEVSVEKPKPVGPTVPPPAQQPVVRVTA